MQCRLVKVIGSRAYYGVFWPGPCAPGRSDEHVAYHDLGGEWLLRFKAPPLSGPFARGWAGACRYCGTPVDWTAKSNSFSGSRQRYDTPNGLMEPGDMCLRAMHAPARPDEPAEWCPGGWTNCDGNHLLLMLPNGHDWDIDSRASNCTLKENTTHRCWIRTGEPPMVTAGEAGDTCSAGAGSIAAGGFHGFLRNGSIDPC